VEAVIMNLIDELFDPEYIKCVSGGREITTELIHLPFDYIFFTGSVPVGKVVMKAAAENLVPVTLELGGKSPTIVHEDANIEIAAKRIAWGKFMNAGQICVAPDYVYVHESIKEAFIEALQQITLSFYGALPMNSPDYCRIVNDRHFERLTQLIDHSKVIMGGQYDAKTRYIAPTIMHEVTWDDAIMADEIFGPILPILTYNNLESVIETINSKPKPLACYVFSDNESVQDYLMDQISFGGGCVNDTISHVASPYMPFGGVGASGMGAYHGEASFKTFSHQKSIIKKSTKFDLKLLYPPYKNHVKWVRKIMK
jgi:aldehyde dehydrogenase (NAD+)